MEKGIDNFQLLDLEFDSMYSYKKNQKELRGRKKDKTYKKLTKRRLKVAGDNIVNESLRFNRDS